MHEFKQGREEPAACSPSARLFSAVVQELKM